MLFRTHFPRWQECLFVSGVLHAALCKREEHLEGFVKSQNKMLRYPQAFLSRCIDALLVWEVAIVVHEGEPQKVCWPTSLDTIYLYIYISLRDPGGETWAVWR